MNDEQINRAIAEVCGWTEIGSCDCGFKLSGMPPYWAAHKKHLPDYCADLNEMHDAEKYLSGSQLCDYALMLDGIGNLFGIRATASQRAEAFLRTLGKWEATDKDSLTVGSTAEESSADHFRDSTKKKEVQG